nr:MAG TPA: hypothetical protein [Caudoviricetes sp.]
MNEVQRLPNSFLDNRHFLYVIIYIICGDYFFIKIFNFYHASGIKYT